MILEWNYKENLGLNCIEQFKKNRKFPDDFFSPSLDLLPDVYLMKDIEKAANRIIEAIRNKERVIIFGHDDLDGITSSFILYDFLEKMGSQYHYYYIPNRFIDNHGLQQNFIDTVIDKKIDLVVTVDGGSSSFDAVEKLNKLGVEVIITDHHIVPEKIPNAFAIVNPKQKDCSYPFDMLAGVGVIYMVIKVMCQILDIKMNNAYLLWTAVGSWADKVPLNGVNRILVRNALDNWLEYEDESMEVFHYYYSINQSIFSKFNFMTFLTRILSNGRAENGVHYAMELLISKINKKKFYDILIQEKIENEKKIEEVVKFCDKITVDKSQKFFIYFDENDEFQYNLIGLIASIISSKYRIPVLIFKQKDGQLVCEGRCTDGFNLVESFEYCKDNLIQFGGHIKAAGFVAEINEIDNIAEKFQKFVELNKESILKNKKIDVDIVLENIQELGNCIYLFPDFIPFGIGNPEPKILVKSCLLSELASLSKINLSEYEEISLTKKYDFLLSFTNKNILNIVDYRINT